ncbi:MAG: hypothetical protein RL017_198, partial [Pseudomonadota bacterium]
YINKLDLIEHGLKGVRMHKGQLTINNINNVYSELTLEI